MRRTETTIRVMLASVMLTACGGMVRLSSSGQSSEFLATPTSSRVLRLGDPGYSVIPIPGLNILNAIDMVKSRLYPDGPEFYRGYPHPVAGPPAQNGDITWEEFPCSLPGGEGGKGCPRTLTFHEGIPFSGCILGFEEKMVEDPNHNPSNPHSMPVVRRYFETGDNTTCSVVPTNDRPVPLDDSHSCAKYGNSVCVGPENSCEDVVLSGVIGFRCVKKSP